MSIFNRLASFVPPFSLGEQIAAGALLFIFMAGLVAVAIGFCDRLKDRPSGIPRIPKAQRNLIARETDSLVQVSPEPEADRPEILFENGKAIIRPHTHMVVPVSTMRLTFQDGEELDVSSDMEFAG